MNLNTGAIGLTTAVLFGGLATTYLFNPMKHQLFYANSNRPYYAYGRYHGKCDMGLHLHVILKSVC